MLVSQYLAGAAVPFWWRRFPIAAALVLQMETDTAGF